MKPLPDVKPGFLRELIPEEPPEEAEEWKQILKDVEPVVLRGNTHWLVGWQWQLENAISDLTALQASSELLRLLSNCVQLCRCGGRHSEHWDCGSWLHMGEQLCTTFGWGN